MKDRSVTWFPELVDKRKLIGQVVCVWLLFVSCSYFRKEHQGSFVLGHEKLWMLPWHASQSCNGHSSSLTGMIHTCIHTYAYAHIHIHRHAYILMLHIHIIIYVPTYNIYYLCVYNYRWLLTIIPNWFKETTALATRALHAALYHTLPAKSSWQMHVPPNSWKRLCSVHSSIAMQSLSSEYAKAVYVKLF